jgi:hypothetical protein
MPPPLLPVGKSSQLINPVKDKMTNKTKDKMLTTQRLLALLLGIS